MASSMPIYALPLLNISPSLIILCVLEAGKQAAANIAPRDNIDLLGTVLLIRCEVPFVLRA